MTKINVKKIRKEIDTTAKNFEVGDSIDINGKMITSVAIDNSDTYYGARFVFDNGVKLTWQNIAANLDYQVVHLDRKLKYEKKTLK